MVMTNAEYGEKYYFLSYSYLFFVNNSFIQVLQIPLRLFSILATAEEVLKVQTGARGHGVNISLHLTPVSPVVCILSMLSGYAPCALWNFGEMYGFLFCREF